MSRSQPANTIGENIRLMHNQIDMTLSTRFVHDLHIYKRDKHDYMEVKINITLENKISHHYQQQIPLTNT
jgi:hypothetical protein